MSKYSIKFILYIHQPNTQGLFPIYLRTIINGKASYKSTGHFINPKVWDEKKEQVKRAHPMCDLLNAALSATKREWESKLLLTQINGKDITSAQLKESFSKDHHNIFEFVEGLTEQFKGKKSEGTLENYRKHLLKLEAFNKSRILAFENIDQKFLKSYEFWLRNNINFMKSDKQKNYIHAIWKTLKTWFNAAKKEGLITHYPFDHYENPQYVAPDKDYLTSEELKQIEEFADTTTDPCHRQTAVYFLFGCYSGLRISDWYQFSFDKHIKQDKIRLRPLKTKHKWIEMLVSKPLARTLERMKETRLEIKEPTINEKLKLIASKTGINKHLTSHTARHSFAVTICLGNKISSETAAELLGINLETFVNNYSQVTQSKIDAETTEAWKELA